MYNERLTLMPNTRYGVSYWVDRLPRGRRAAYPRHRGHLDVDVAVVGGGFAGCATAHALTTAGARVALFEGTRVGQGAIGSSTALVMQEPDVDFLEVLPARGLRATRAIWQMTRRATLDLGAAVRPAQDPLSDRAAGLHLFLGRSGGGEAAAEGIRRSPEGRTRGALADL